MHVFAAIAVAALSLTVTATATVALAESPVADQREELGQLWTGQPAWEGPDFTAGAGAPLEAAEAFGRSEPGLPLIGEVRFGIADTGATDANRLLAPGGLFDR